MSALEIDYNAVASFERSKAPKSKGRNVLYFTVALLVVFFIVLMTGLASGVAMYQAVANNQIDTNNARMQAGLIASNIHANDSMNSIGTGEGPEGRALVLTDTVGESSYEMRIYLYEGNIVQEYSVAGAEYTPARAQPLIASTSFDFEQYGNLLVIHTDQGATNIALRSYQGGAA